MLMFVSDEKCAAFISVSPPTEIYLQFKQEAEIKLTQKHSDVNCVMKDF